MASFLTRENYMVFYEEITIMVHNKTRRNYYVYKTRNYFVRK